MVAGPTGRRDLSDRAVRSDPGTLERAYDLAQSGMCASLDEIEARLRAEGHITVLTELRSRIVRRDLRALCRQFGPQGRRQSTDR